MNNIFWLNYCRKSYILPKPPKCIYVLWGLGKILWLNIQVDTLWVHILLVTEWSVSHETKKHIVTKDVIGLLIGEVVRVLKKTHRRKGCGWLASRRGSLSTKKNTSSQMMWLAY